MFIDMTGRTGLEHARDMRRSAPIRATRATRRHRALRSLTSRTELNPTHNYRAY
jgi:hypothetical protein